MEKKKIVVLFLGLIPFLAPVVFSLYHSNQYLVNKIESVENGFEKTIIKNNYNSELNFLYAKTERKEGRKEKEELLHLFNLKPVFDKDPK